MKKMLLVLVTIGAASLTACATGGINTSSAPSLHVVEKLVINAPADKVWEKINNFGDLGAWHPAVAKTEIVDGTNNQVGAIRRLTLQDGGQVTEVLTA